MEQKKRVAVVRGRGSETVLAEQNVCVALTANKADFELVLAPEEHHEDVVFCRENNMEAIRQAAAKGKNVIVLVGVKPADEIDRVTFVLVESVPTFDELSAMFKERLSPKTRSVTAA